MGLSDLARAGLRLLKAGSVIRDAEGRVLFLTDAEGWVSTSSSHFSVMGLCLPVEVLYKA